MGDAVYFAAIGDVVYFAAVCSIFGVPALVAALTSYRLWRILLPGAVLGVALLGVVVWEAATADIEDIEDFGRVGTVFFGVFIAGALIVLWAVGALLGGGVRQTVCFVRGRRKTTPASRSGAAH